MISLLGRGPPKAPQQKRDALDTRTASRFFRTEGAHGP
jgi:hypothetical protein